MSKERMYGWNGEMPAKEVGGQCKIVLDGLRAEPEVLRGGHAWAEIIGKNLRTKQDPYRVVLYYILILKSKGVIRTNEFDIVGTTKTEETGKHQIVVKTRSGVDEIAKIEEPVEPTTEELEETVSAS